MDKVLKNIRPLLDFEKGKMTLTFDLPNVNKITINLDFPKVRKNDHES